MLYMHVMILALKTASKIQNENTLPFKGRDRVGMGYF